LYSIKGFWSHSVFLRQTFYFRIGSRGNPFLHPILPHRSCVNFINVLCTAFMSADPKSVKIQSSCQYLFALLGSTCLKALSKILMKLTLCREQSFYPSLAKLTIRRSHLLYCLNTSYMKSSWYVRGVSGH